MSDVDTVRP